MSDDGEVKEGTAGAGEKSGVGTSQIPLAQQPVRPGRSVPGDSWWTGDSVHVDEDPEHRE